MRSAGTGDRERGLLVEYLGSSRSQGVCAWCRGLPACVPLRGISQGIWQRPGGGGGCQRICTHNKQAGGDPSKSKDTVDRRQQCVGSM